MSPMRTWHALKQWLYGNNAWSGQLPSRRRTRRTQRYRAQLSLEQLEDRNVPSADPLADPLAVLSIGLEDPLDFLSPFAQNVRRAVDLPGVSGQRPDAGAAQGSTSGGAPASAGSGSSAGGGANAGGGGGSAMPGAPAGDFVAMPRPTAAVGPNAPADVPPSAVGGVTSAAAGESAVNDAMIDTNTSGGSPLGPNPPVADLDRFFVKANSATSDYHTAGNVLFNDFDPDDDPITAELVSGVSNGTLTFSTDGIFTYKPNAGFVGSDTFWYRAFDGSSYSLSTSVAIYVDDFAPQGRFDEYWLHAGQTLTVPAPGVLANDWDWDDVSGLTVVQVSGPQNGTGTLAANGSFTYTPNATFVGNDSFVYEAFDGVKYSGQMQVAIHVENLRPVGNADSYDVWYNGSLSAADTNVLRNDYDPDGDSLQAVLLTPPSFAQSFTFNANGTFSYTPMPNPPPINDSFTYQLFDGFQSDLSTGIWVTIRTTDVPIGVQDNYIIPAGGTLVINSADGVLANDFDTQHLAMQAILDVGISPDVGTLALNVDGSFTFTQGPAFSGQATFTYHPIVVGGPQGGLPAVATLIGQMQLNLYRDSVGLQELTYHSSHPLIQKDNPGVGEDAIFRAPHWLDTNQDGVPERTYPRSFTRGTRMQVSARFFVSAALQPLWSGRVLVRADGPGNLDLGYNQVVQARLAGNELIVAQVALDNPLANEVYAPSINLQWQLSPDNGRSWITPTVAHTSVNQIFVTLDTPNQRSPLLHTFVRMGSHFGSGATTWTDLLTRVWVPFANRAVTRASDGAALGYYRTWVTREASAVGMLRSTAAEGMCGAWANLLVNILWAQGITQVDGSSIRQPVSRAASAEYFLVKDWNFAAANLPAVFAMPQPIWRRNPNDPPQEPGRGELIRAIPPQQDIPYTRFNQPVVGDILWPDPYVLDDVLRASSVANAYQWAGQPSVTDINGIPGQNSANPHSIFPNHVLVKANNVFYDPSYGRTYTSIQDFENNGVAGYVAERTLNEMVMNRRFRADVDFNQNGTANENVNVRVFVFRQKLAGQNDLI